MPVLCVRRCRLGKDTLWLSKRLFDELCDQARDSAPNETGGMLLGWERDRHMRVVQVVGPGPATKATSDSFEPDGLWQQRELETAYRQSAQTVTYLGDWHSHPQGRGRPSARDARTAAEIAAELQARAPEPLVLIIVKGRRKWRPCGFRYINRHMRRIHVQLHAADH
jgi:integrative and conjugative element protein (TIGR02256 family)